MEVKLILMLEDQMLETGGVDLLQLPEIMIETEIGNTFLSLYACLLLLGLRGYIFFFKVVRVDFQYFKLITVLMRFIMYLINDHGIMYVYKKISEIALTFRQNEKNKR